jgi:Cu(I)/Ag(I) efflux system membrane fusion protein
MMDFIGRRPGDCPVCGMKMAPVEAGELSREQQQRMGLELVRVTEGPATALVRAHGIARYDERTFHAVVPRVAGRVVRRHPAALHPGTVVQAGDPVVDLFSPEVFTAQGELAAALKLADAHAIHALVERFLRWQLPAVAQAVIAGGAPLDTVTLVSPYAGVVLPAGAASSSLAEVGTELTADAVLLRLADPEARIIALQVPEARAPWLRTGQTVTLATEDGVGPEPPAAEIAWISPALNPDLRAREVHLHVRATGDRLPPGSVVEARVRATLAPDLTPADPARPGEAGRFALVPRAAILSTGVRHVAWRVAARLPDGRLRLELVPVALGPRLEEGDGGDRYVVRAGLRPGDEVAARGAFLIDSQAQLAGNPSLLFPAGLPAAGNGLAP